MKPKTFIGRFLEKHPKIMEFLVGKKCPRCKIIYMNVYNDDYRKCPKCGRKEKVR
jgi:Zn ribbon nucleic-acid-binding protein